MIIRAFLLFSSLLFAGCTSPDASLWRVRPLEIQVGQEQTVLSNDLLGTETIYLPPGAYRCTKLNDLGFVYECDGATARRVRRGDPSDEVTFRPAIVLSNRSDEVFVAQVAHSLKEFVTNHAEFAEWVLQNKLKKQGYLLLVLSRSLTAQQRESIGLPGKQEPNHMLGPTPASVTPAADAPVAPATTAALL
jgi:hypothetical protein